MTTTSAPKTETSTAVNKPTATRITMVEALNRAIREEMERDETVLCLGEDVGVDGGVFRVTKGLLEQFGRDRVVDTPLSEAGIVGTGIGLALGGMRPICEIQFSGFLNFAFEQIQPHCSRFAQRTSGGRRVPMVIRAPSGGGIRALEHHSESEEAMYVHTPGLITVMPSGPANAYGLMKAAIRSNDTVMFFEPKSVYRAVKEEVPENGEPLALGKAAIAQEGTDLTVVTWGAMVRRTKQATEKLDASVEILDMLTLNPFDHDAIIRSVSKTGRLVVVHEAPRTGGLAGEIFARVCEDAFYHLRAPMRRVCGWDVPYPLLARENAYLPDVERIAAAIHKTLGEE